MDRQAHTGLGGYVHTYKGWAGGIYTREEEGSTYPGRLYAPHISLFLPKNGGKTGLILSISPKDVK